MAKRTGRPRGRPPKPPGDRQVDRYAARMKVPPELRPPLRGPVDPESFGAHLGERMRSRREAKGLSQGKLSQLTGVPQSMISLFESGHTQDPGVQAMKNIAIVLGVSVDWLIGLEEPDLQACLYAGKYQPNARMEVIWKPEEALVG